MTRIPRKRLIAYGCIIAVLGYALAAAVSRTSAPRAPLSGGAASESSTGQASSPAPSEADAEPAAQKRAVSPGPIDKDDALLALNSLGSDDEPVTDELLRPAATITPIPPTPSAAPRQDDDEIAGERDNNDARAVFADAQPTEPFGTGDQFIGGGRTFGGGVPGAPAAQGGSVQGAGGAWVSGQARGYAMLYAMQPQARAVVESHVATLLSAQVREPYIGVLVDGTFKLDLEYLKTVISRLSVDRNLTLELYLSNGATQRKFETTSIGAPFVDINPVVFRKTFKFDEGLKREFSVIAARARDLFQYSSQRNSANQHLVSVMLEDNLDVNAYRAMRDVAARQLDGTGSFIRSTCFRCFAKDDPDSDTDTAGDAREEHTVAGMRELRRGDGFTLDGTGFRYPGDTSSLGSSSDEVKNLIRDGYAKGLRFFALWRHSWQGADASGDNPHPEDRNYVVSTPEQEAFELELLRLGLTAEPADDTEGDSMLLGANP